MDPKPVCLIVEDKLWRRLFAIEIAEKRGFSILEAADADNAIHILQEPICVTRCAHGNRSSRLSGRLGTRTSHSGSPAMA